MRTTLAALMTVAATSALADPDYLAKLRSGDNVEGFRVAVIYLGANDVPQGARFIHRATNHTLDLLQIESVPQAYTWINSIPVSEQGEPHTQEHLLLLKGTMGRTLSTRQTMSLSTSTAFTQQWRTSYMFNTSAGPDVFFDLYAEQLKAMLHPNYTDVEIRGEVRNFGVTGNPDGTLRLEEKGTVYNEMVSSTANPFSRVYRAAGQLLYGVGHPMALNAGGEPSGIRTMKPEDIRKFQRDTHHLANMGTIAAFSRAEPVGDVLRRFDRILSLDTPAGGPRASQSLDALPAPNGAAPGSIRVAEYPHRNDQQPSPVLMVWPPVRPLDANERMLADLFVANIAGDATTNLYKLFIDGQTRRINVGARSVFGFVRAFPGNPIYIGLTDVAPANLDDEKLAAIRALVVEEIRGIAALADGSPELKAFNARIANRLVETRRDLGKFVSTPAGFGFRGGGSQWMDHLLALEKAPGTRKSLVMTPQVDFVRKLLATDRNFWREYLAKWRVTDVVPYVAAARPSPALIQREEYQRVERIAEETTRIQKLYGLTDPQAAIRRYRDESDAEVAKVEEDAKQVTPTVGFVKSPPLTLDDALRYDVVKLPNGVPLVASRFDGMASAMLGMAVRVDTVPKDQLRYLSLLPVLLTRVGVIENGKPVPYEQMRERLRNEVLALDAYFASNPRTGRVELVVRGAGMGEREARRAIDWMALAVHSPDWRLENLARIRDVVDQSLGELRNTMQAAEENWVNNPADAYRMQRNPAHLAASSFLTRGYNALRLRWQLKDAGAETQSIAAFLAQLGEAGRKLPRSDVKLLLDSAKAPGLGTLTPAGRAIALEALKDLDLALIEMPDASLGEDFAALAAALREDLLVPPAEALRRLDGVRRALLRDGGARMFSASTEAMLKSLTPAIETFASRLDKGAAAPVAYGTTALIDQRLAQRGAGDAKPLHLGLYAPNKQGGVIITSTPAAHFADHGDREKQLDYLTSRLFAGGGPHGVFLKTLAAGLAYSNGIRGSVAGARGGYYAERTPELPQTVRFVVDTIKSSQPDVRLGEYVMAQAFAEQRSAATYESRAEGMAADLADGQPPEQVRRFRESILQLRSDPELVKTLFERKDRVHARFLPGYVAKGEVPDGLYFVVGPDKQLDAWEAYLKEKEGTGTRLHRLYGRDFWMP